MHDNINYIFSYNFNRLLKRKYKTLAEFAKDTGTAYSTASDWKNGKKLPRSGGLRLIADYFDTNISYLITDHTNEENEKYHLTEIKNNDFLTFEGKRMSPEELTYMTQQLEMFRSYKKSQENNKK